MSRLLKAVALSAALGLAGCAPTTPTDPATAGNHQANPNATGTAVPPQSNTLAILDPATGEPLPPDSHDHAGPGDNDGLTPLPGASNDGMNAMKHDMAGMKGMDHDAPTTTPTTSPTTQASADYTCPMHPEVHADAPGRCPICNMKLVKKEGDNQ